MNKRTYFRMLLLLIIAITTTYLIFNWDKAFTRTVKIQYSDGCIEVYKNENLVTPECTTGRLLQYQKELEYNRTHNGPWNNLNLTLN